MKTALLAERIQRGDVIEMRKRLRIVVASEAMRPTANERKI